MFVVSLAEKGQTPALYRGIRAASPEFGRQERSKSGRSARPAQANSFTAVVRPTASAPRLVPSWPPLTTVPGRGGGEARRDLAQLARRHDPVDEAVLDGLLGAEEAVALHVLVDLLLGLVRVARVDLLD